jgi:PIN domain nuclease of toxin-antitoxin system
VLDAWAILALLRDDPGATEIERAVDAGGTVISWINLGEVFYIEARIAGQAAAAAAVERVRRSVGVEDVDADLVLAAARVKARHVLSYADAFAVALAERLRLPLLTGDPELLALDRDLSVVDPRGRTGS